MDYRENRGSEWAKAHGSERRISGIVPGSTGRQRKRALYNIWAKRLPFLALV